MVKIVKRRRCAFIHDSMRMLMKYYFERNVENYAKSRIIVKLCGYLLGLMKYL